MLLRVDEISSFLCAVRRNWLMKCAISSMPTKTVSSYGRSLETTFSAMDYSRSERSQTTWSNVYSLVGVSRTGLKKLGQIRAKLSFL